MNRRRKAFELFEQAFDLGEDEARQFIQTHCDGDSTLKKQVEALLAAKNSESAGADSRVTHPPDSSQSSVSTPVNLESQSHGADRSGDGRFLPGARFGKRFRIVSLVGRGAMGEVYRADDLKLGHAVAIKILPKEIASDPHRIKLFHDEVRLARQISHPHVCRVYDIDDQDGTHFISMEYVDGEDLKSLLRRIGRLPTDKGIELAHQICAGLAAAHDAGVIHRDLKPANIMIDGAGQARIADFGLALEDNRQTDSEVVGTPIYMSPEQLSHGVASIQSDIFSLGLVLHEVFTGKRVFDANSIGELRQQHAKWSVSTQSNSLSGQNPLIATTIQACLEDRPEERPRTVRLVAASLPGGEPLAAALAEGRVPSPDQVAASGGNGEVGSRATFALLAAVLLGLFALVLASPLSAINRAELREHPQLLIQRAEKIARAFGYSREPQDTDWGFVIDRSLKRPADSNVDDPRAGQHASQRSIVFWYRQSPRPLTPTSFRNRIRRNIGFATYNDPPLAESMFRLLLHPSGRLLRFEGLPPKDDDVQGAPLDYEASVVTQPSQFGFSQLETLSEQSVTNYSGAIEQRCKIRATDEREESQLVEFASTGGHVVEWQAGETGIKSSTMATVIERQSAMYIIVLLVSILLAWYHHSVGLGDRVGANRLARFALAGKVATFILVGSHSRSALAEAPLVQQGLALSLFAAAELWAFYMAVEPIVRRIWPQNLIAWYRLLSGRYQDRLVGQKVLIGVAAAVALSLLKPLSVLVADAIGQQTSIPLQMTVWPLHGAGHAMARLIADLLFSVHLGLTYLIAFLLLRMILRLPWVAVLAFVAVWTSVYMQYEGMTTVAVAALGISMFVKCVVVWRAGLLSLITILFVERVLQWPITMDTEMWYFSTGLVALLIAASIGLLSAYTSLGGRVALRNLLEQGHTGLSTK